MDPTVSHHSVLFYDCDPQIEEAAARFLLEGMQKGNDAIVVATPKRRAALFPWLVRLGMEEFAVDRPRLFLYDAKLILNSFLVDGMPHPALFQSSLMPIFAKVRNNPVVFGEIVDVLAQEGNLSAALKLEELWNQEIADRSFPLFCGYARCSFGGTHGAEFEEVCRRHSQVHLH